MGNTRAYLYYHTRLDTNQVFYIGIGSSKKRAYSKSCRNKHWVNTVNKYGYEVQILTNNIDIELIKKNIAKFFF